MAGILLSLLNLRNLWTCPAMNLADLHNSLNLNGLDAMKRQWEDYDSTALD